MKYSLKATSIIESIVVLLIVVTGITGVYSLMNSSQKLAESTGNRIEAIQIARDGIEAFINIRDTNWLKFSADFENCWNVLNYEPNCIWNDGNDIWAWSYVIYKNTFGQFELASESASAAWYIDSSYRSDFAVEKDTLGFYTQSWGTLYGVGGTPFYTRELQVSYPKWNSNTDTIQINSIVQWKDSAKNTPQKLEVSTTLTNWKSKQ